MVDVIMGAVAGDPAALAQLERVVCPGAHSTTLQ